MTRLAWLLPAVPIALLVAVHGCQGPETFLRPASPGVGGNEIEPTGTGGNGEGGVTAGTGGLRAGTGGSGAGGTAIGTGGKATGTGGVTTGTGGLRAGTGGSGTGGMIVRGTGGDDGGVSSDAAGTGGMGTDAAGTGTGGLGSGNCIDDIIGADYTSSSGMACSACHDNTVMLEAPCKVMIDCLEKSWPACAQGSACWLDCLHAAQGSGELEKCVLGMTASCP